MKYLFLVFVSGLVLFVSAISASIQGILIAKPIDKLVISTKRIYLPSYPGAYNPSIIKFKEGYLMIFRYLPSRYHQPWLSCIGAVLLNNSFEPISHTQLIDTRFNDKRTFSQAEDPRVFSFDDRLFLIYNDNMEKMYPSLQDRRDMYIAELFYLHKQFFISDPVKLVHESRYDTVLWQKNWSPFVWNGSLLFSYSINPHEVVIPDLSTGICKRVYETNRALSWNYGTLRGSAPVQLVDGEYLGFFHSGTVTRTTSSDNRDMWHYFMGAYTFAAEPPFELTKISPFPIDSLEFYTYSSYEKRVIYPGGFVVDGSNLYLSYGKDDSEIWIATIDLNALKDSLVPAHEIQYR